MYTALAVSHNREASAPATEIEITSEMIEAGVSALLHSDYRYIEDCSPYPVVSLVYRAMVCASPSHKERSPGAP